MNIWITMFLGGAITFGMRMSFIYLFGRFNFPSIVKQALRFVPPAVLSAIIAPALFISDNKVDIGFHNHYLVAGSIAILIGWQTKNTLITILIGMTALLVMQILF